MKNTRLAASTAAAAVAVVMACGSAHAAPDDPVVPDDSIHADIVPGVGYNGSVADNSVVVTTPFGSLTTRGTEFQVLDPNGDLVSGTPLTYQRDVEQWPDAARPQDVGATPTGPRRVDDASGDALEQLTHDVDASADFSGALALAATQFGLAVGVGTVTGGVIGMGLGCVGGALTGGFVAIPTGPIAPGAAILGCIMGGSIGAGIGGVTGAALLGIPVGIASAVQMYDSMHAAGHI